MTLAVLKAVGVQAGEVSCRSLDIRCMVDALATVDGGHNEAPVPFSKASTSYQAALDSRALRFRRTAAHWPQDTDQLHRLAAGGTQKLSGR